MVLLLGSNAVNPQRGPPPSGDAKQRETAIEGTTTFYEPLDGPTAESALKWIDEQIPYENLATDEHIADRAVAFVTSHEQKFRQRCAEIHDRWRIIQHVLRGHTLSRSLYGDVPLHVPKLYQQVEKIVPRLVEMVYGYDPWFMVKGRTKDDRDQQALIREFLRYQLYEMHFEDQVEGIVRTMLTFGVCPTKLNWYTKIEKRIKRTIKREIGPRGTRRTITRAHEETVVYDSPRLKLVNPFNFIIDPYATSVQDALFVGDVSTMTLDEIMELGEQGVFANTEQLLAVEPQTDIRERYSLASIAGSVAMPTSDDQPEGGPKKFKVVDMSCLFDAEGTKRTREFIITVVDGRIPVRVVENFHDDKHRPYACARAAKEPFTFHNIGPADHAVALNMEIDDFRNMARVGSKLNMCPITFVDEQSDAPTSLLGIKPGSVYRASSSPTFFRVPNPIVEMAAMEQINNADLQECMGAPSLFDPVGGTATEVDLKVKEQNKRLRGMSLALTSLNEHLLRQMHSLNGQYLTQARTFRVLGRDGHNLRAYDEINPEVFDHEVDFEFMSTSSFQNAGLRATQLQQFLTVSAPFLQAFPNIVNIPVLLKDLYQQLVGSRLADDVITVPQSLNSMITQWEENIVMAQGQRVATHEADDDKKHMEDLNELFVSTYFGRFPSQVQNIILEHYNEHAQAFMRKRVKQQAANNLQPSVPTAPNPQEIGDPGRGTTGTRGPSGAGWNSSATETPPGETPGPARGGAVRSADRAGGLFQSENKVG